jgi:hypothetical protein
VDSVITTPSTVALDAVLAGKPVGVVGYDLELPLYEPLPILRSGEDWGRLVATTGLPAEAAARFLRRNVVRSDAGGTILDRMIEMGTQPVLG